eukprot:CAMPEP_0117042506 /NCGR_PEP_ID=MMETSP0472-20121206/29598_1 /TAXON_ID=693140 ORGANISM="Tiarina fusus, Strain LIS" /NCGR_SAMPLE_ID=MMETSP0472 /ASSEMBLY_ACC=CAM_ASM_000603 /LENGTH=157 /DNA_ID=CAMNT_0004753767 /DNA_START=48 /DNA_END=521 /DNA_ORIENTATION=+
MARYSQIPATMVDLDVETKEIMLSRGPYGEGFGFVAAKESMLEMKLNGWMGTHLWELIKFADGGLHVAEVTRNTSADRNGLLKYDVIQKVNGQDVRDWTAKEITTLIKTSEGAILIEVARKQDTLLQEAQMQWDHISSEPVALEKVRTFILKHIPAF